jgi:hypothetical protein
MMINGTCCAGVDCGMGTTEPTNFCLLCPLLGLDENLLGTPNCPLSSLALNATKKYLSLYIRRWVADMSNIFLGLKKILRTTDAGDSLVQATVHVALPII